MSGTSSWNDPFRLYAFRNSWYSAKVRAYLQNKGIPFEEQRPTLKTFQHTIPARCAGAATVPVVVTPEGEWLQDSSVILDRLEERYPHAPILPTTPVQRFFSLLCEIWADEFWHPTAEHYRFSFPENYPAWRDDLAALLPGAPRLIQSIVVRKLYRFMLEATRDLGVTPEKTTLIERWSEDQLNAMDQQLASTPYLLGDRASLADFALMGPINGHLAWDIRSVRVLIEPRPNLKAWIDRMSRREPSPGDFLPGDAIPETLRPLLVSLFKELILYVEACAKFVVEFDPTARRSLSRAMAGDRRRRPDDPRLPRSGDLVEIPFGDGRLRRVALPYVVWMAQRLQDRFRQLAPEDSAKVRAWFRAHEGERVLDISFPRVRRVGLCIAPEIGPTETTR